LQLYIALETAPGAIETVRQTVKDLFTESGVEVKPFQVFGIYDLVLFIDDPNVSSPAESYTKFNKPISRSCEGKIRGTTTFFVLRTYIDKSKKKNAKKISAYIFLSLIPHLADLAYEKICGMKDTMRVSLCSGAFDGIVEVEADSLDGLSELVDEIQMIPGVMKTVTFIVKKA
jgi:uncharacterized protein with GYD domain